MTRPRVIYVNVSTDLLGHWKVEATADALGIERAQVVGHLVGLWAFAANATDESQAEGDLSRFPASVLERQVGWAGKPGAWAQALRDHGWVDADGRVHDWLEHAGRGIAALATQRERMRARRGATRAPLDNGASTVTAPLSNGASTVRDTTTATATATTTATSTPTATEKVRLPALARGAETAIIASDGRHAERQALWSAFDVGMGAARTQNERGRRAKAVGDLLDAGVTPDEVTRAIAAWPRVMRDATLTETGIASHVGRLCAAPAYDRAPNGRMSLVELVRVATADLEEEERARGTGTLPSGHDAHARVVAVARGR